MKLMDIVGGMNGRVRLIGNGENVEITALTMDSRKKLERGAMFFCIPGFRFDGHDYAAQAVEAGVSALVVERELDVDCPQLLVSDVREAAARIAAIFYGHPAEEMKLIGITGTKGKTTTSYLVKSILETAGYKVGLIGTVCSMIGDTQIPSKLTTPDHIDFHALLRQMADAGVEYVVMEVSAHAMELRRLIGIQFEVAAFTNLSQDHLDMFGSMEKYCAAKMLDRLMSGMGRGVRCEDRFGPMMLVRRESTRGFGRREARILPVMELIRRIFERKKKKKLFVLVIGFVEPAICIGASALLFFNGGAVLSWVMIVAGVLLIIDGLLSLVVALAGKRKKKKIA